jgi:hypothetical protein
MEGTNQVASSPPTMGQPVTVKASRDGALLLLPPPAVPSIRLPTLSSFKKKSKQRELQLTRVSSSLTEKVVGDVLVGGGVALSVTPFLTVIDKAITQRSSGTNSILKSCFESIQSITRSPVAFVKSPMFLVMWGTYAVTYSTANSLKTIFEHREWEAKRRMDASRPSGVPSSADTSTTTINTSRMGVFAGTAVMNSAASLLKDQAFARMFGSTAASATVPFISYGLWMTRDALVVGSSFLLPEMVSGSLQDSTKLDAKDALRVSQIACPVATQVVAGPLHLLALDYYNRPLSTMTAADAAWERLQMIKSNAGAVIAARVARIAPGYGLGGVVNTHFRDAWRDHLIQKEIFQIENEEDQASINDHVHSLVELVYERNAA